MKKSEQVKKLVIEQLCRTPIVEAACQKAGVSRMTFYRWKKEDKEFAKAVAAAIQDGRLLVNDLAESQLVGAIKDRNLPATTYWLRHHHPDYANTLRIKHAVDDEGLTPEEEAIVREALRLGNIINTEVIQNYEADTTQREQYNLPENSGDNDPGPENPAGDSEGKS